MPEFNATLLLVIVSFVIFMLAMKAIYFDPMLALKKERERTLDDNRTSTQRFSEEFESVHAEYEAGLKQARQEAHRLIQELRTQTKQEAQETLSRSRTDALADTDRQLAELAQQRDEAYARMQPDRASLARLILDKVMQGGQVSRQMAGER